MRRVVIAIIVLALCVCAAGALALARPYVFGGPPSGEARGFVVEYATGSIPPPWNHSYRLQADFGPGETVVVSYTLAYHYREHMSADELKRYGFTAHDDIAWSGTLTGTWYAEWRALVAATRLSPEPGPLSGGDHFQVQLVDRTGAVLSGRPANEDAWSAEVDKLKLMLRPKP